MAKRQSRGPQPRSQDVAPKKTGSHLQPKAKESSPRMTGSHLDPKPVEVKARISGTPEVPHNAKPKLDRSQPKSKKTPRHETKRIV